MRLSNADIRAVGLDFIEFLHETQRSSINQRDKLKDIYNNEFRNRHGGKDPNFSSVLYVLRNSNKARVTRNRHVHFKPNLIKFIADKNGVWVSSELGFVDGRMLVLVDHDEVHEWKVHVEGEKYEVMVKFHSNDVGTYQATVAFEFKSELMTFHIVHFIKAEYSTPLGRELAALEPYTGFRLCRSQVDDYAVDEHVCCRPDNLAIKRLQNEVPLMPYEFPDYADDLIDFLKCQRPPNHVLLQKKALLKSPLEFCNHTERFQVLLYLEERQMDVDIRAYDKQDVTMKTDSQNKKLLVLECYVHRVELDRLKLGFSERSHKVILKIPNEMFYDGELQPCADEYSTSFYCNWEHLPKKDFPLIFHGVPGKDERESNSPSFFNTREITVVIDYLKKLLLTQGKKHVAKISPKDIGIIAPYRKQVEKLRKAILKLDKDLKTSTNIQHLKVGSVKEFQGQERRVIIVSTVRSSSEYLEDVALTRARSLLIIVGNPVILSTDTTWCKLIDYCTEEGGCTGFKRTFIEGTEEVLTRLMDLKIHTKAEVETEESSIQQYVNPEWRNEQ